MKVLVTGSSGLIGFHILEELSKQGLSLRAAYRPGDPLQKIASDFLIDGLDLDCFSLDVTDRPAVFKAMQGVQLLFHAEHLISFNAKDKARLYAINQIGTRNVAEAALHCGVEKMVYTAGSETLRAPRGQEMAREQDGVDLGELKSHFEKSRYLAERELNQFKQRDLPVIILHPTVCLGRGDRGITPFGHFLLRYLRGKVRFYLDTGFNLVDAADVAKAHLLAAKRGEVGRRYILGNQNVYLLEILQHLEKETQIPMPKTALPAMMAKIGNTFVSLVRRSGECIPNTVIDYLQRPRFFDSTLAVKELGMPQSSVWEALRREIQDMKKLI